MSTRAGKTSLEKTSFTTQAIRLPGTTLYEAFSEAGSPDERRTAATGTVGVDKHMSTASSAAVWNALSCFRFQLIMPVWSLFYNRKRLTFLTIAVLLLSPFRQIVHDDELINQLCRSKCSSNMQCSCVHYFSKAFSSLWHRLRPRPLHRPN